MNESVIAMMEPISVVIPARNRPQLVERAIVSVLNQWYRPIEIIVVDDESDPPLANLISSDLREKVILIRNSSHRNAAASRNIGVSKSTSRLIAFLDSDDIWHPSHLRTATAALSRQSTGDALYMSAFSHTCVRKASGDCRQLGDIYEYKFGQRKPIRTSTIVMSRRVHNRIGGFDEALRKHQDWDLVLRAGMVCPVLSSTAVTVVIDKYAEERMSAIPDLPASVYFMRKHGQRMNSAHIALFVGNVVQACARTNDYILHAEAKRIFREVVETRRLHWKHALYWHIPRVANALYSVKERLIRNGGR